MNDTPATTSCDICSKETEKLTESEGLQSCPACLELIKIVTEDPEKIKRIWRQTQDEPILPRPQAELADAEIELPEVLDGKRYRTIDREFNKWYLSVSEIDGNPVEIFASTAFERDHQLQSRISNLTTITRLISLILRHVVLGERLTLDKCLVQIKRSSRQKDDLPDMLYGVLSKYNTSK